MTVDNTDGEPINLTHIQIIFYCMNIEYICIVFHSESNNSGSLLECSNVLMLGWKKCHIVPRIPSDIVGPRGGAIVALEIPSFTNTN